MGNGQDSNAPSYTTSTKTCNSVYCHSDGISSQTSGTYDGGSYGEIYIWRLSDGPNIPPAVSNYATPAWDGTVNCGDCHKGGNPVTVVDHFPLTGKHIFITSWTYHVDGDYEDPNLYARTQCFWCHSTDNTTTYQGTYGTQYHVDGNVYFHPLDYTNGGTMWSSHQMKYENHCGRPMGGSRCWYK